MSNINLEEEEIKVSIIIPAYNVEKYIFECVNSVLNNTLKNIEVICINDGSTDKTLEILTAIKKEDYRLKIYSQENKGVGAARNYGICLAKGKYILFVDSDDKICENTLEYLYSEAEENLLDMLMFNANTSYYNQDVEKKHIYFNNMYQNKNEYHGVRTGKDFFVELMNNGDYRPNVWLYLVKKFFLTDNNINFYEGIIHEDNNFTLKCITLAKRVKCNNVNLYTRVVRENSIMTSSSPEKRLNSYVKVLDDMIRFVNTNKLVTDIDYYRAFITYCRIILNVAYNLTCNNISNIFKVFSDNKLNSNFSYEHIFFQILLNIETERNELKKEIEKQQKNFEQIYRKNQENFEKKYREKQEEFDERLGIIRKNTTFYIIKKVKNVLKKLFNIKIIRS